MLSYERENIKATHQGGSDAFVTAVLSAYNTHGELVLSPDDVCLAIQLQCGSRISWG